jgi:hypothetical protein
MEQRRAAAMFFSLAVAAWRPISSWFYADARQRHQQQAAVTPSVQNAHLGRHLGFILVAFRR